MSRCGACGQSPCIEGQACRHPECIALCRAHGRPALVVGEVTTHTDDESLCGEYRIARVVDTLTGEVQEPEVYRLNPPPCIAGCAVRLASPYGMVHAEGCPNASPRMSLFAPCASCGAACANTFPGPTGSVNVCSECLNAEGFYRV